MFARTARLLLRPGWPDDAPALHAAIADERIVTMLARAPWPYAPADAADFLTLPPEPRNLPRLLIFARTAGAPALVGGIGLMLNEDDAVELGYWIAREAWGRGYATEAGHAVLDMAAMLGVHDVVSGHFIDNPASGRVLAKLGFVRTGRIVERPSQARGASVPMMVYVRGDALSEPLAA